MYSLSDGAILLGVCVCVLLCVNNILLTVFKFEFCITTELENRSLPLFEEPLRNLLNSLKSLNFYVLGMTCFYVSYHNGKLFINYNTNLITIKLYTFSNVSKGQHEQRWHVQSAVLQYKKILCALTKNPMWQQKV